MTIARKVVATIDAFMVMTSVVGTRRIRAAVTRRQTSITASVRRSSGRVESSENGAPTSPACAVFSESSLSPSFVSTRPSHSASTDWCSRNGAAGCPRSPRDHAIAGGALPYDLDPARGLFRGRWEQLRPPEGLGLFDAGALRVCRATRVHLVRPGRPALALVRAEDPASPVAPQRRRSTGR